MNLGWTEILLIAFVVLLLFGGKKIPELMRGLGRGVREFKDAKDNVKRELEESVSEKDNK
jgi:sec-independent protein translocase protein TatA